MTTAREHFHDVAMMLRQFGRLQLGRLVGTVLGSEGRYRAAMDLLERCYFMRAELNAVVKILIDKKIVTAEEWEKTCTEEYEWYVAQLAKDWPEIKVTATGYTILDPVVFARRSKEEGWPP